jgi:hypothetical protein
MRLQTCKIVGFGLLLVLFCACSSIPPELWKQTVFSVGQKYVTTTPYLIIQDDARRATLISPFGRDIRAPRTLSEYRKAPGTYPDVIGISTNAALIRITRLTPKYIHAFGWVFDVFGRIEEGDFSGMEVLITDLTEANRGFSPDSALLQASEASLPRGHQFIHTIGMFSSCASGGCGASQSLRSQMFRKRTGQSWPARMSGPVGL